MSDTGIVKSIEKLVDVEGHVFLEVVVRFYGGNCPELKFSTVWESTPVKIIETAPCDDAEFGMSP